MFKSVSSIPLILFLTLPLHANPDEPSTGSQEKQWPSIWEAARTGDLDTVVHWCIYKPELLTQTELRSNGGLGHTPFFNAVASGHLTVASFLIKGKFAAVDRKEGPHEMTPLAYAALVGNEKMVELLHDNGASLEQSVRDGFGETSICAIARGNAKKYIERNLSYRANNSGKQKKSCKR